MSSFGSAAPGTALGEFNTPRGVAVNNTSGDVYVADSANNRIEEFSASGIFVRSWGQAGVLGGGMTDPQGVAVNQATGDVYVTDEGNLRVDEFGETGGFIRAWGAGVVASGTDNVPVNARQTVTVTATGGTFTLTFVTTAPAVSATTTAIAYNAPAQGEGSVQKALESLSNIGAGNVAVAGSSGAPYNVTFKDKLADTNVAQMTANGAGLTGPGSGVTVTTTTVGASSAEICSEGDICQAGVSAGTGGGFAATFDGYIAVVPAGAPDAGNVIVADPGNSRVQEFTATGEFVRAFGADVNRTAIAEPSSTSAERDLCAAVSGDLCGAGAPGSAVGQFAAGTPTRVAVDSAGAIYTVESSSGYRVQKLTPSGGGLSPSIFVGPVLTGTGPEDAPSDVAVDPATNGVYVVKGYPEGTGIPPAVFPERRVLRLSSSDVLEETDMIGDGVETVDGLGIDPAGGRLYVSSTTAGQRVYVLEDVPATSGPPFSACPNERLRAESDVDPSTGKPDSTELPDCRAYEQVTPDYKDGFEVPEANVSTDGSQLVGFSLGTFAGAEGNPSNLGAATYQFARTSSGWLTTALNPPASTFAIEEYIDRASDDSTVWALRPRAQAPPRQREIYIRAPGGMLSDVGPLLPANASEQGSTPRVVGESQDLSHIFFSAEALGTAAALWPFDSSDRGFSSSDLYEYTGTNNTEPELVGVSGPRGSRELIGQCGMGLDALSASGETVFFNVEHNACGGVQPPVGELYARVSREKTVSLSEPILPQGESCTSICMEDRNETGGHHRSPGVFQGASEDGSKVFFTTSQPLLDSDKGAGNELYMAEVQGTGQSAAVSRLIEVSRDPTPGQSAEVQGVARISQDGSHVYFVAKGILAGEPNGLGQTAILGADNLYAYDTNTQRTTFVATLPPADSNDWTGTGRPVQSTPDGNFLVFLSRADLTGDAPGGHQQVYRYDASTGSMVRISIGQDGFNQDGTSGEMNLPSPSGGTDHLSVAGKTLSDDGSHVFFTSTDGLTPGAENEVEIAEGQKAVNVYEWEADHNGACALHTGCVWLITDGHDLSEVEGTTTVNLIGTDASGDDVFFVTSDRLALSDTNTDSDIYDARVDGGFPAPSEPVSCSSSQCQIGESPTESVVPPSSTSSFTGASDLVSALATTTVTSPSAAASAAAAGSRRKSAAQVRAEALARGLRACRSKKSRAVAARRRCEAATRKRFGPQANAKRSTQRSGR